MAVLTIVAHGMTVSQRYVDVDNGYLDLHASTQMEVGQSRKRNLDLWRLGHVEIDDP
jgi:hypothetical protein